MLLVAGAGALVERVSQDVYVGRLGQVFGELRRQFQALGRAGLSDRGKRVDRHGRGAVDYIRDVASEDAFFASMPFIQRHTSPISRSLGDALRIHLTERAYCLESFMTQFEFGCQIPAWHWHWDVSELRDWAQGVEAIGCDFISMADHIIYAYARDDRPQTGPYTDDVHQHEVMTTLAWLAGITNRVALQTNVLVLPQREPVLVAKQAAEIDILSGGRMRLGIGIGWQWQEFDALTANFRQRPSRMEEYIRVLRACWTEEPINFNGRYVNIDQMSVMPKPVTPGGPPILFGGFAQAAIERTARLGDGWIAPVQSSVDQLAELIGRLRAELEANDRDPDDFPIQWLPPLDADMSNTTRLLSAARDMGITRLGIGMPNYDRELSIPVDQYLQTIETAWREVWPEVKGS